MKKMIVLFLLLAALLTGCGNEALGFGNYSFKKIHVDTPHYSGCFTVEKWHDNSTGIEVKTKEAGSMYFSEGTYVLIEEDCPFCTGEE